MLNRKFADLRHSPRLDPRVLSYADGKAPWLDQEDYEDEVAAGTIPPAWQKSVSDTVAALDCERAAGDFPPDVIQNFRPGPPLHKWSVKH
jgi:hypothetical protein